MLLTKEPEVKWFEQQRELKRVKRDGVEQHVKKRDFGEGPQLSEPAREIWDDIFADLSSEGKTNPKRKRQNRFASSFSDPMFRYLIKGWILQRGGIREAIP